MNTTGEESEKDIIRIFVAATSSEWLPARVLEYSIREYTQREVTVSLLYQSGLDTPTPKDVNNLPRTPFSFQRFLIPELCSFSGRAIYMDADMQVFQDISHLWHHPFNNCDLLTVKEGTKGRKGQFSVMLLDCKKLNWNISSIVEELDSGRLDYAGLMYDMAVAKKIGRVIDEKWNSLESFSNNETALLHYTDMNTQPWISTVNPLGYLWVSCLRRAIRDGFVKMDEVSREVELSHVRPSLLPQLGGNIDCTIELPRTIKRLDKEFTAPYRNLESSRVRPWKSFPRAFYKNARRQYYNSFFSTLFR